jgi:hypothetical protein
VIGDKSLCEGGLCYCSLRWKDLRVGREWEGLREMGVLGKTIGLIDRIWNLEDMA